MKEKTLKIFKENGEYHLHRINQFGTVFKRSFISEEGLKEGLDAYLPVMHEYEIEASEDVWALVVNHLGGSIIESVDPVTQDKIKSLSKRYGVSENEILHKAILKMDMDETTKKNGGNG